MAIQTVYNPFLIRKCVFVVYSAGYLLWFFLCVSLFLSNAVSIS